jgi:hypothetical protein
MYAKPTVLLGIDEKTRNVTFSGLTPINYYLLYI